MVKSQIPAESLNQLSDLLSSNKERTKRFLVSNTGISAAVAVAAAAAVVVRIADIQHNLRESHSYETVHPS